MTDHQASRKVFMASVFLRKDMDQAALGEIQAPPVCDFCGLHAPRYIYAAERSAAGRPGRLWRWAACESCAEHVEAENFTPIILQITEMLRRNSMNILPPAFIRQCVDMALGEFRRYAIRNDRHNPSGNDNLYG